jgi:hypothetical protein
MASQDQGNIDMEQPKTAQVSDGEVELESVSGGEVKQTGEAYIPYVGTFLWFDNGCMSFMSEDLGVTHYCG